MCYCCRRDALLGDGESAKSGSHCRGRAVQFKFRKRHKGDKEASAPRGLVRKLGGSEVGDQDRDRKGGAWNNISFDLP